MQKPNSDHFITGSSRPFLYEATRSNRSSTWAHSNSVNLGRPIISDDDSPFFPKRSYPQLAPVPVTGEKDRGTTVALHEEDEEEEEEVERDEE